MKANSSILKIIFTGFMGTALLAASLNAVVASTNTGTTREVPKWDFSGRGTVEQDARAYDKDHLLSYVNQMRDRIKERAEKFRRENFTFTEKPVPATSGSPATKISDVSAKHIKGGPKIKLDAQGKATIPLSIDQVEFTDKEYETFIRTQSASAQGEVMNSITAINSAWNTIYALFQRVKEIEESRDTLANEHEFYRELLQQEDELDKTIRDLNGFVSGSQLLKETVDMSNDALRNMDKRIEQIGKGIKNSEDKLEKLRIEIASTPTGPNAIRSPWVSHRLLEPNDRSSDSKNWQTIHGAETVAQPLRLVHSAPKRDIRVLRKKGAQSVFTHKCCEVGRAKSAGITGDFRLFKTSSYIRPMVTGEDIATTLARGESVFKQTDTGDYFAVRLKGEVMDASGNISITVQGREVIIGSIVIIPKNSVIGRIIQEIEKVLREGNREELNKQISKAQGDEFKNASLGSTELVEETPPREVTLLRN